MEMLMSSEVHIRARPVGSLTNSPAQDALSVGMYQARQIHSCGRWQMPDGMPRHHKRYVSTVDCIHRSFCLCFFFFTKHFREQRGAPLEMGVKGENVAMIFQNEVTDRSCQLFFCF